MNTIEYPINFFDFETFQNAIPRFDGQRPYMQIPFQYSLHILYEDGTLEHKEFLGDQNSDPRQFRRRGYYHADFNGDFSIKSVLPAMFPNGDELDYKKLNIQNVGMAMDTFGNLHLIKDKFKVNEIKKDLLAYCRLDTLAMVRIWEKLKDITNT